MLPCLRCGQWALPVSLILGLERRETVDCLACGDVHYLEVKRHEQGYDICFQRYTLRYPLEFYDEGVQMPVVQLHASEQPEPDEQRESFSGPIIIYPRRRIRRASELRIIWDASERRCHLCGRRWKLASRGRSGWHVDHIIPHAGGGADTESTCNLRVACWRCNLSKGRGYSGADVRWGLQRLVACFQRHRREKRHPVPNLGSRSHAR